MIDIEAKLEIYWNMTKMIRNYENVVDFSLLKQTVTNRFLSDLKNLLLFDLIDLTSRLDIDIYSNFLYLTFYHLFTISSMSQCFYINRKSRFISDLLQSIRTKQLVKIRKRQIRKIFNNIRLRNRIASNSHFLFSTNNLKNRSFYHTKHRFFFRLFISKISNFSSYKSINIFRCKFTICSFFSFIFRTFFDIFVFSHVCRICNDIFESNNDLHWHLRTIHFDHLFRHEFEKHQTFERNIMTWKFLIFWRKNKSFFYFFWCIINKFLEKWIACFRHAIQRKRCNFFSLMTFVTIKFSHKIEIKISWQKRISVLTI